MTTAERAKAATMRAIFSTVEKMINSAADNGRFETTYHFHNFNTKMIINVFTHYKNAGFDVILRNRRWLKSDPEYCYGDLVFRW